MQAALKCMGLTADQLIATHDSSLGFHLGLKFIVHQHTLIVVLCSNDTYTQLYDDDIIAELRSDDIADVLVLSGEAIVSKIPQLNHNNADLADIHQ